MIVFINLQMIRTLKIYIFYRCQCLKSQGEGILMLEMFVFNVKLRQTDIGIV